MKFIDLLTEVKMYEGLGLPADSIQTLDQFVNSSGLEEADMLGATTRPLTPDEMQDYLAKTAAGKKTKLDKYTMPYVHRGNIEIKDEMIWNDYYITHGDLYDGVIQLKWLGHLGSWGYELAIWIDRTLKKLGYKKSLSAYLKLKVKEAVKFITRFEKQLEYQAEKRKCMGVICGHIHTPEIKEGYINCGDWIESNSYIIYTNGGFKLLSNI